jgi:catechol 2,3-dioxygenase-like lactoylglutathione lyase family enzyme
MPNSIASLGEIIQLAFVPKDIDAAFAYWTKVGAGPFFRLRVGYDEMLYRGQPTDAAFSLSIGYWGNIHIELIEQHNDSPSSYRTWLDEGREGLHHVAIAVDDIDRARASVTAAGLTVEQEVVSPAATAIFVEGGAGPGTLVEIVQLAPVAVGLFAMMRNAARDWDGSDPLRELG